MKLFSWSATRAGLVLFRMMSVRDRLKVESGLMTCESISLRFLPSLPALNTTSGGFLPADTKEPSQWVHWVDVDVQLLSGASGPLFYLFSVHRDTHIPFTQLHGTEIVTRCCHRSWHRTSNVSQSLLNVFLEKRMDHVNKRDPQQIKIHIKNEKIRIGRLACL